MSAEDSTAPKFRLMHTMLRVMDLEKSIDFYTRFLGMKLLRKFDVEPGRFTLAFIGYGEEDSNTVLELTYNWDQTEPYELGTAYGHIALAVKDLYGVCDELAKAGVSIPRPPGPMKGSTVELAFIEDPDGYKIELVKK